MGRVEGKVVLITGAARGQGRSHAITLAEQGADIIAVDVCADNASAEYPMATPDDLARTVEDVEALGRRAVAVQADVRDREALDVAVTSAVERFGRLDVAVANAGICVLKAWDEVTPQIWDDTLAVGLTGVWNTMAVAAPHLIAAGGGSIIAIGSTAAIKGMPFLAPYAAAKHGVVGLAQVLANELGRHHIRVNTVHPTGVRTTLVDGLSEMDRLLADNPGLGGIFRNTLPVDFVEARDVSNAVLYLASDESRYVTALSLTVDAGNTNR